MKFYGLFGEHLSHSLSPQLHRTIYKRLSLDAGYKLFPFQPDRIHHTVDALRLLSINGVNVTIPYKEAVLPYLDYLSSVADDLKVVNTIKNDNGILTGFNTDYDGFGLIFKRRNWVTESSTFVILGTGGAAKVVQKFLLDHGARSVTFVSRSVKEESHDPRVSFTTYDEMPALSADFLINTTPVGMYPNQRVSPIEKNQLCAYSFVIDLIYNPSETILLQQAKSEGKQTANGLDMLVGQAVRSVEIWEELTIDPKITDELIEAFEQWGRLK